MALSLLAAVFATLAAAVFTGMLLLRCTRLPRLDLAAWVSAEVGLTVALAAQALGYSQGFTSLTFRAVQVGAQLIAPLALVWGLVEVSARSPGARFASRLALGAVTVIGGVVMATDPLGSTTFSTAWPAASVYYQVLPSATLELTAVITVLAAVIAALLAVARARRDGAGQELLTPVLAGAGAALLTEGLRFALPLKSAYPALCLLAAGLAWFAGTRTARVPLGAHRDGPAPRSESDWDGYDPYGEDTGFGRLYRSGTGPLARHRADPDFDEDDDDYHADTGFGEAYDTGTGFGEAYDTGTGYGLYRDDTGGFGAERADTGHGLYGEPDTGFGQNGLYERSGVSRNGADAGIVETGDMLAPIEASSPVAAGAGQVVETERLYGQIAIYTLLEGRADEFDRLAGQVMEEVRTREPDALVYVMHDVPSAPMQRILYEVYRDEAAFAEHSRQPYIVAFEEDRKPCVLATNVIELGVRHAKVLPLADAPRPASGPGRAHRRGNGSR